MKHSSEDKLIWESYDEPRRKYGKRGAIATAAAAEKRAKKERIEKEQQQALDNAALSPQQQQPTPVVNRSASTHTSPPHLYPPFKEDTKEKGFDIGDVVVLRRANPKTKVPLRDHPVYDAIHHDRNTGKIVDVRYKEYKVHTFSGGEDEWYTADQLAGPFEYGFQTKDYTPVHPDLEHL